MSGESGIQRVAGARQLRSGSAAACGWPSGREELIACQQALAAADPPLWRPGDAQPLVGACFVCFSRGLAGPGAPGDPAWAAASCGVRETRETVSVRGRAGWPYEPGLLALREGPLLESAVRALEVRPEVLLVDATARDHPRGAGLALQLGAVLGVPTVGVTHRPLVASGVWPERRAGARSALVLEGRPVGAWARTRAHARPLAVHPGWRVDLDTAVEVVLASVTGLRTPQPLRRARQAARRARASDGGTPSGPDERAEEP